MARSNFEVREFPSLQGWAGVWLGSDKCNFSRHIVQDQLKIAVYHGAGRRRLVPDLDSFDVVLTTYETLRVDRAAGGGLYAESWLRVVLDEGE